MNELIYPDTNIEWLMEEAIAKADVDYAFSICKQLIDLQRMSGLALSQALGMLHENWRVFEIEESFFDNAAVRLDIHKHTVERYVRVYQMLTREAPPELVEDFKDRNIKDLIPIANAIAEGYEIEPDQWDKLAVATNFSEISEIVREEVKGIEPKKGSLQIKLSKDGSLWTITENGMFFTGSLEVHSDEEDIQRAITRIVNHSGILRM